MRAVRTFNLVVILLLAGCSSVAVRHSEQPGTLPEISPGEISPAAPVPNPAILGPGGGSKSNMLPQVENAQVDSAEVVEVDGRRVLRVRGSLPSACHELRAGIELPDARGLVRAAVLAVLDRAQPGKSSCEPASTPFEVELALDSLPPGAYRLLVNETLEINFSIP